MAYPGLPLTWLLTADDRIVDTIVDLHEEETERHA